MQDKLFMPRKRGKKEIIDDMLDLDVYIMDLKEVFLYNELGQRFFDAL